jgi:hypothetical protein
MVKSTEITFLKGVGEQLRQDKLGQVGGGQTSAKMSTGSGFSPLGPKLGVVKDQAPLTP